MKMAAMLKGVQCAEARGSNVDVKGMISSLRAGLEYGLGIWPGSVEAEYLGMDLNELARSGNIHFLFVKPGESKK